jgi:methyl-accepting chemotaxis protein
MKARIIFYIAIISGYGLMQFEIIGLQGQIAKLAKVTITLEDASVKNSRSIDSIATYIDKQTALNAQVSDSIHALSDTSRENSSAVIYSLHSMRMLFDMIRLRKD